MPSDKAKRVLVGIDPGLSETGVVVMGMDYNVLSANLIKVEASAAKRLYDIETALDKILVSHFFQDSVTIFIEGYAYGAKYQRESLAELGGVLRRYFYINTLTYWVIPPLLNKKYVTGSAKANKNFMKKMTKEKWGHAFKSDDVCDAYGLARLGVSVIRRMEQLELVDNDPNEGAVIAEIYNNQENYRNRNTAKVITKKYDKRKNST